MTPGALYGRLYSLALGKPNAAQSAIYGNEPPKGTPLRFSFEIEKTATASTNKAKVTVYNLTNASRQAMAPGFLMQLRAGYRDLCQTLFVGNVSKVVSETSGSEIMTKVEAGDGEAAIATTTFNQSYGPGTTLAQVLSDVAKSLAVTTAQSPVAIKAGIAVGIPAVTFNKGFIASGAARDTLSKLLRSVGLEWSIQNGALTIIPKGAHNGKLAEVVSPQTGLIGVPSKNGDLVQVITLLNPRLVPGGLLQLRSGAKELDGVYKVRSAKFEGDTHDSKWQATIQAVRMPSAPQTLKSAQGFAYQAAVFDVE